jgi:hypothetical protein
VQIRQGRHCNSGQADLHAHAGSRVKHPGRDDDYDAGRHFNMDHITLSPALAVVTPQLPPVQRMPPVMHDDFLLDMGRMTQGSHLGASLGCSAVRIAADNAPQSCIA